MFALEEKEKQSPYFQQLSREVEENSPLDSFHARIAVGAALTLREFGMITQADLNNICLRVMVDLVEQPDVAELLDSSHGPGFDDNSSL